MEVKIQKLKENARIPGYAYADDAGLDLYASEGATVPAGGRAVFMTGIAMEIPSGYVGLIWDRSGNAIKRGLKTIGGVIDAGYRGEITIGLFNTTTEPVEIKAGEKIAQMLIQKVEHAAIREVETLSETERSDRRWGSSDKKKEI